ncbi:hypothetical protein chiPu_0024594 [Chiloscyllium punctatum]|uniref:Uncharacterized protein n=1 Tax=Chiloscyllium punctatum TaxID=137246 RepID=A0A401TEH1_CHIPU|nr:hypothetical protein [Chiloscyllium punctatum]
MFFGRCPELTDLGLGQREVPHDLETELRAQKAVGDSGRTRDGLIGIHTHRERERVSREPGDRSLEPRHGAG